MHTGLKTIIAMLGAVNVAFSILIPISISLLLIKTYPALQANAAWTLLFLGSVSSLYRAINVGFIKKE